jgi:hypothetical protein
MKAGRPGLQPAAFVLGFGSVLSFLHLARSLGGCHAQLRRVLAADGVALVCLVVGAAASAWPGEG